MSIVPALFFYLWEYKKVIEMGQSSLDEILITDELSRRTGLQMSSKSSSSHNFRAENEALSTLARQLVEQPQTMLKTLVTIAKDLCQAGTAGVSLLEKTNSGEEVFRWAALAGDLVQYEQGTIPRQLSPCGVCLDRRSPQLYSYPARYFTSLKAIEPPIVEALIIPLMVADQPLGAIWIVSHDPQCQFDTEDVRVMNSLADFTAAALYSNQTRQAAESAQSLLHLLLEYVPEGITIAGGPPDFPLIANSKLAQQWLGRTDESLLGMASGDHVQPYGLFLPDGVTRPTPEQLPLYRATRYGETIRDEECIIERPDGTRITVNATVAPVRNSQGDIIGAINCWRDVTERKRIEEALRQREAELSLVTNTVPVLISFVDAEQRYRFNNRTYEEWFGYPASEVYGKALWEVVGDAAYQAIRPYVEQALAGQQATFEGEIPCQDGGTRYVSATYIPRFDTQGTVEGFVALVNDISQHRQAELALRKSEERLRFAQQAAKAGVWDWDLVSSQVTWSEEYYYLYGLDPATTQPSYDNWLASIVEPDRARVDRVIRETLEHQSNLNVEFRILHPTQGERWITAIGQTFYDTNRRPTRMSGIALDITDRKQSEEALRESEARFRHMADTAPVLMWMSGPDKLCHYFNQPWLDFTGRTLEQELGNGWAEGVHPEDFQYCLNTYVTAFDARQPFRMEYRLRRFDGVYRWIVDEAVPRFTAEGDFLGYIGSCIDIEDRKQAELEREQRLTRERQYIDQLQGLTTAALAINSALAVEQMLQVMTDQAAAIIGAHQAVTSMTIDRNWAPAITAVYLSDKYAQWQNHDQPTDGSGIYARICHLDRPMRMTQAELEAHPQWKGFGQAADHHPPMRGWLAAPLVGRGGQNIGVIQLSDKYEGEFTETDEAILVQLAQMASVVIEKARLYEAEQQARAAAETSREEAQAANRIKDEFLAVLSHELRTPLNPILGWSKLLRSRQYDKATIDRALETIERNAKLQTHLIEDLLDISRVLQGKLRLESCPINLSAIITAAIETVHLAASSKSIQIQTHFAPIAGTVTGDPDRLQQVVWNLLSNAIKFTPRGGRVEVRLECVVGDRQVGDRQVGDRQAEGARETGEDYTFSASASSPTSNPQSPIPNPHYVQIRVTDTGQGIDPEFLPYMFEDFRQADSATTRKFGGLGLGLAIARHIVELHGGVIAAASPGEGQGATFVVRLPLLPDGDSRQAQVDLDASPISSAEAPSSEVALSQQSPSYVESSPLAGLRILLVDDETDSRDFFTFVLKQAGAKVTAVGSAMEALQAFKDQKIKDQKIDVLISDIGMPDIDGYTLIQQLRNLTTKERENIPAIALTAYAGEINQQKALAAGFQSHLGKPVEPDELVKTIVTLVR